MNKKIVIITVVISIILLIIIGIVVFTVLNKEESTSTQAPSSTSTQAPSSTSTQTPSPTSTQAPSPTSTQAPSSTSTQAPSSTSTQAPSSTNECIYGSFSNWSDCDKGKRIRTKRVLIKPTGKICEDIIEEDLEYCKGFNCILSDDWVKKQECSFDMTTGEYTETFTKEILQTPSKGGLTCEEVVELEQKENDTNDEPSTNRILPSYIRTFKNNIYSYFRENPQMKITSITNNLVTDQRPGSKYSCNAPCSNYSNTDTNLSVNCITELWNSAGCLTVPSVAYNLNNFNVPNTVEYNFNKQTLSQDILNKSQTGGVGLYDRARILNCYGNTYTNNYPYLVANSTITNTTGRYTQTRTVGGISYQGITTPTYYYCAPSFNGSVSFSNYYNKFTQYGLKNILDIIFNIPNNYKITYNLTTNGNYPIGFTYNIIGPEISTTSSTCPTSSLSITFSYAAIGEELYL